MKKQILSILLACSMVFSSTPAAVFADTPAAANQAVSTTSGNAEEQSEVRYVTMNVPYDDFYAAYDLTDVAVWDVNGEGLDAVSTATTNKFLGTTGLANGTYNDGTYILGVTIPVAVKAADYAKLDASLTEGNYAFTDLTEAPAAYSELTVNTDGSYSFSAMQAYTGDTTGLSVIESASGFTTAGYGDYQIDLEGVGTNKTLANGTAYNAIYGAVLYTDNGKALGMTALENLWFGNRVTNVEIAWSVPEGQGLKRGHGSGDAFYQFADICGQKLTKVDVITDLGVISIPCEITLTPYLTGEDSTVTAAVKDTTTMTVSYPAALEDATVSVTYRAGRASTTLADKVTAANGEVALNAALNELETTYTITVYSSNYAPISTTLTYGTPAFDYYKAQLEEKKDEAAALVAANASLTTLAAHVTEAEELLAKEDATSAEFQALISELDELIEEAKANTSQDTEEPAVATIKASNKKVKAAAKAQTVKLGASVDSNAALTYASSSKKITVDKNGNVKVPANYVGKATITITAAATDSYKAATKKVTVTVVKANKAQSMTVKAAKKTLKVNKKKAQKVKLTVKKAFGKVTYKSNKAKVKVSAKGVVTVPKNFKGTVKITVKAAGNNVYKAAKKTISIKVK